MTFEEWTIKQGFKHPEFGIQVSLTQYALMQNAWNAAIEAALAAWNEVDADDIACLKSS